jgi:hypothetical protein
LLPADYKTPERMTAQAPNLPAEQGRADSAITRSKNPPRASLGWLGAENMPTSARRRKSDDRRNQQNEQSAMSKPADPVENFLKASKDYSDALHSSDDSVLEAAKAAMKVAEKALRNSRNPKS